MEESPAYQGEQGIRHAARAAVALVHYGDPSVTIGCIESIRAHEGDSCLIVVADHGPDHKLRGLLPEGSSQVAIQLIERQNLGFGSGCNAAAEAAFKAGAEWVWFLNNDARLGGPVLSDLLGLARSNPSAGLWGTLQRDGEKVLGSDVLPGWFPTPPSATAAMAGLPAGCRQLQARETLSGASILAARSAWERLGPWPEWCFLYWEDVAWCMRAHGLGIPIVLTDLEVLHPRNTTTGRHSPTTTYYGARNGLLLHEDCWPERRVERARQAIHLLQKRFFQGNWHMLGPTMRGILDARKGVRFMRG